MPHNGGRLQINPGFPDPWWDPWALNLCKIGWQFYAVDNAGTTTPSGDWASLLDDDGYPTALPTAPNTKWRQVQVYIYGEVNDVVDLYFPSQHTVSLASAAPGLTLSAPDTSVAGRKRYTITAAGTPTAGVCYICTVEVTAMGSPATWVGGITLCLSTLGGVAVTHKALLDSGEIFTPEFLARLGYGSTPFGYVRFMDWGRVNNSFSTLWAHRKKQGDFSWNSPDSNKVTFYTPGVVTKTGNDYVTANRLPGNPVAWTDGQLVQMQLPANPTFLTVTSVTIGNPTTFTSVGHGLTTGKKIAATYGASFAAAWVTALFTKSLTTGLAPDFTVTRIDDDNFTIPLDSTGFAAAPASFSVNQIITFSDGTLPAKRAYRKTWINHFVSEWGTSTTNNVTSAIYHEEMDALIYGGDNSQSRFDNGIPVEVQIALCRKLNCHGWFNLHWFFTSASRQSYMQVVKDGMDYATTGLKAIFEITNEPWNSGFNSYEESISYSRVRFPGTNNGYMGYGAKISDMSDDASTVFGSGSLAFEIAINCWDIQTVAFYAPVLECAPLSLGNSALYPANKADFISTAPYLDPNWILDAPNAGYVTALQAWVAGDKQTYYNFMADSLLTDTGGTLNHPLSKRITYDTAWVNDATAYTGRRGTGLKVRHYEGGNGLGSGTNYIDNGFPSGGVTAQNAADAFNEYLNSAQHAVVLTTAMDAMVAAGVEIPSVFVVTSPWSSTISWGVQGLNTWDQAQSPAHLAMLNWNAPVTLPLIRSGGAGHRFSRRFNRTWRGKYAGYFDDREWVEYLLAAMSGEIAELPAPPKPQKPASKKLRRKVIEPEAYIEKAYPEVFTGLLELKLEELETLALQRQSAQVAKLIEAAARKKRRYDEEDNIAFLFMAA